MATKVVMEALSPTMEEGRLVEWKKREGEAVATGDVLAEVETDKAVMELVARGSGVLLQQVVAAGATVPVAQIIGWIGAVGEAIPGGGPATPTVPVVPAAPADAAPAAAPAPAVPAVPAAPVVAAVSALSAPSAPSAPSASPQPALSAAKGIKASPLARKIAADTGVNLASIAGSGPEGRIIKRDLEGAPAGTAGQNLPSFQAGGYTDIPLSQMRKTIAKRLALSIGPIPTFYLTVDVDMERAHEAREALQHREEGKFSFNDLIIRSCAAALRLHPWVNAWWSDTGIRQWHEIHIGVAVAVEEGLMTPIVRHADQKTLREIGGEIRELAQRARDRKLKPEEYTGATFSVSNLGMFGIEEFTAIINPPEVAILAIGRIEPKAVVIGEAIQIRRRMRMTLSCDHRVVDGATGAAFLQTLVGMLENPLALVW